MAKKNLSSSQSRATTRFFYLERLWKKLWSADNATLPQVDRWLAREFTQYPSFGGQDRAWYREFLFSAIRFAYLALFCEEFVKESGVRTLCCETVPMDGESDISSGSLEVFLTTFLLRYPSPASLQAAFYQVKFSDLFQWIILCCRRQQDFLSLSAKTVRQFQSIYSALAACGSVRSALLMHSIPLFYESSFARRKKLSLWDETACRRFLNMQMERPPLWLRVVNGQKMLVILQELESLGMEVDFEKESIAVANAKSLANLKCFVKGWVEVQDLASQLIGARVLPRQGQWVWDCCAGGGGKTLQIAARLAEQGKGFICASDIREYKLAELAKRVQRAGFPPVLCQGWDGENLPQFPIEVQRRGGFDWVLLDAPCSATGTWRRSPDAKYRYDQKAVDDFSRLQKKLISRAKSALRAGGILVYATCSWLCEENEDVVSYFLNEFKQMTLIEQTVIGSPVENCDTMFVAVFQDTQTV